MKKVIRGRVYDTSTARHISSASGGGENCGGLFYWEENIYCKRTGEYFLHCWGNAGSQYAEHHGTNSETGETIKPLTYSEAQKWAEKYMDGDEYIKEFGEPEADYTKKTIAISITQKAVDKLKKQAQVSDKSMSEIIEKLIEEMEV